MVSYIFDPKTPEAEASGYPWVQDHPDLYTNFQSIPTDT